ncbi:hypothetical protein PILCRDRAFT_821568 [Piloderma croceum F 1598]|uniref:Uncharacterized protein n=1 Tax=Piloderma croceum (strain F 1598) TaxID=765440 RepID=A0A0C3FPN6_PILCF|nr:hypothetical protein PILCRDRAFT_821568 [Piloderma croceum F 1598]
MPAPASEFRFSIKYTGAKAARLASGSIPQWEVRSIFKDDLTALGANLPKNENIQQGPSASIYFIYTHNMKTSIQHKRYLAVESTQNTDILLLTVKTKRSIELITYSQEQRSPALSLSQRISAPSEQQVTTCKPKERSASVSSSDGARSSLAERDSKCPKLTEWSAISEFQQESEESSLRPRSPTAAITEEHSVPSTPTQIAPLPKTPIEIEHPPAVIPSSPTKAISDRPTKITIPLAIKPAKAPVPSRSNAFSTFTRTQEVSRLTRELWDTRRVLSAAKARESTLVQHIELLTDDQSGGLGVYKDWKHPPPREPLRDSQARLKACEIELEREIKQRELTEQCFEDVKRECKNPSVVPALLKAFAEIAFFNDIGIPLAKVEK